MLDGDPSTSFPVAKGWYCVLFHSAGLILPLPQISIRLELVTPSSDFLLTLESELFRSSARMERADGERKVVLVFIFSNWPSKSWFASAISQWAGMLRTSSISSAAFTISSCQVDGEIKAAWMEELPLLLGADGEILGSLSTKHEGVDVDV